MQALKHVQIPKAETSVQCYTVINVINHHCIFAKLFYTFLHSYYVPNIIVGIGKTVVKKTDKSVVSIADWVVFWSMVFSNLQAVLASLFQYDYQHVCSYISQDYFISNCSIWDRIFGRIYLGIQAWSE